MTSKSLAVTLQQLGIPVVSFFKKTKTTDAGVELDNDVDVFISKIGNKSSVSKYIITKWDDKLQQVIPLGTFKTVESLVQKLKEIS